MSVATLDRTHRADPLTVLFGRAAPAARTAAICTAVGISVLFVTLYAISAVTDLTGSHDQPGSITSADAAQATGTDLEMIVLAGIALAAAVLALGPAALGLHRAALARPVAATVRTFAVLHLPSAWIATGAGLLIAHLVGDPATIGAYGHPAEPVRLALTGAVMAGFCEEILVLAIPLAIARRAGWTRTRIGPLPGTWALGAVLVAARMSYHLYYGTTALVLLPWAIASLLWYTRTGALLPLIAAHIAYDAVLTTAPHSPTAHWVWLAALTTTALAAGIAAHQRLTRAARADASAPGLP